ncbi:uncharacterized protein TRIADDRAFT_31923 [Trichoplax adhaerens]|uniref:Carboxylesterase type B domain-containing protein n=1 Tax=Trichoplax adhaerens TaxID=10228 RepID=B3SA34_TRIAD|nr:hypothetical protein TRIADDRAFT_31923 [Trichoplax adhaerens]EDV20449.1 hypothetical protein TRIADDRAFT_31923 [Trichoplax adhaerens]|eukprot:XP_002117143.1 hypothetical protein TRIADDRAFT_31923 [Trichoplax adhaerens]
MGAEKIYLCFLTVLILSIFSWANIVQTDKGPVQSKNYNIEGKAVYGYLGIPFAQPPVGNLRFQSPQPIQTPWTQTKNTTTLPYACPQALPIPDLSSQTKQGQVNEDCLYMNVWTPTTNNASNLAVFVFIHGGAYYYGSGSRWQGKVLSANQNIVTVTMNYRLGAFGFMTTSKVNDNYPIEPNLGLLDQQLALKWIRNNIAKFGGNPQNVTIAGNSVGAVSVGLHTMSQGSKGLFHRIIMESGAPIMPQFYYVDFKIPNIVFQKVAQLSNCSRSTAAQIVTCLRALTMKELLTAQLTTMATYPLGFVVVAGGQFLPDSPETLLKNGQYEKVNTMLGTTTDDGSIFLQVNRYQNIGQGLPRAVFLGTIAGYFAAYSQQSRSAIEYQYTKYAKENDPIANRDEINKLFNDFFFVAPADKCARKYSADGVSTYYYEFAFRTQLSTAFPPYMGVTHTMEVPYVMGYPINRPSSFSANFTSEDVAVSRDIMQIWGSFIKHGTPTMASSAAQWPMYNANNASYFKISNQSEIRKDYLSDRVAFWNKLLPKLGVPSTTVPTPTTKPTPTPTKGMTTPSTTMMTTNNPAMSGMVRREYMIATYVLAAIAAIFITTLIIVLFKLHQANNNRIKGTSISNSHKF